MQYTEKYELESFLDEDSSMGLVKENKSCQAIYKWMSVLVQCAYVHRRINPNEFKRTQNSSDIKKGRKTILKAKSIQGVLNTWKEDV